MARIKNPSPFNDDPARDIAIDLSGSTRGLIPSIERDDDDGDDEAPRLRPKAPKKKKLSKKAQGKHPIRKLEEEEEEKDKEEEENDKLRKYEELLTTLKISLENTQGTMRRSIVDMFRARNHLNARVNDLETYVGSIDDDGDDGDEEDEGQQNQRSLAQRQDGYEVAQDNLSEQQMVLASQQQRLDRRLADIEYCLHLNAPERSQSAPPRPADPAAGLFPPWSEGYWGGRRSPSRLVGVWGPRSTRSSRREGGLPGTGSGSGAAGIKNMGGNGGIRSLGPPVSGPTSTIPAKRKSGELEADDDDDDENDENDRQKKSGKGGKKQKNNSGNKVEGEDQESGPKPKATNAKKSKGKDKAKTTGTAKPAPKILLKVSEYQRAKDQERGEGEKEDHRTGKARPEVVLPKNEKRKAEDDGDEEEKAPRRNRANTRSQTGTKNDKGATTAAAPQATSESTSSKTTSEAPPNTDSKTAPKTAPKIILKRRRGDDTDPDDNDDDEDDQEPEKKKAKVAPKKTKAAAVPKKTTKKKAASKSKTRPSSQGAPPAPAGLAPVAPLAQPTDRLPPPDEDEFDY
ncbi:hypothetical protein CH35J_011284 [Colletotrichum higginsianum]|uniref:Uncharacterized protein n=1 Tax=Colletotrichum higginsianum TaxID=80884 RepID=A0A4T0VG92_9PEZI|nr:hypothetical protein CH35J_011284 [Colletotrichum higginsianum]